MARTEDQARWERKAREGGRQRVAVWLSESAVMRLDELTQAQGLRGRGEALERLLGGGAEPEPEPEPRYRLRRWRHPAGLPGWEVVVAGEVVGQAWVRHKGERHQVWVSARAEGLYPHQHKRRTRAEAVEALLAEIGA